MLFTNVCSFVISREKSEKIYKIGLLSTYNSFFQNFGCEKQKSNLAKFLEGLVQWSTGYIFGPINTYDCGRTLS